MSNNINIIDIDNYSPITYVTFKIDAPDHNVTTIGYNHDDTYTVFNDDISDARIIPARLLENLFNNYPALVTALKTPWCEM